jgi:hypothetical protein
MVCVKAVGIVTLIVFALTFGTVTALNNQHRSLTELNSPSASLSQPKSINIYVSSNDTFMLIKNLNLPQYVLSNIVLIKNTEIGHLKSGDILLIDLEDPIVKTNKELVNRLENEFLKKKGIVILYTDKGVTPNKLNEFLSSSTPYNIINSDKNDIIYYVFSLKLVGEDKTVPAYYSLYADSSTKVTPSDINAFISTIIQNNIQT